MRLRTSHLDIRVGSNCDSASYSVANLALARACSVSPRVTTKLALTARPRAEFQGSRAAWLWRRDPRVRFRCTAMQVEDMGISVSEYVRRNEHEDLVDVFQAFQDAVKQIASRLSRAALDDALGSGEASNSASGRDDPKKMDVVANDLLKDALAKSKKVAVMASEEDEEVFETEARASARYAAVFDPLDGSSNIDACIPTGTILGIYPCAGISGASEACLQPGSRLMSAAYALYSSATMIVLSVGSGVVGFTLDSARQEFVLTHRICIPRRGQMYSLNDARQFDWPPGLRRYIDDVRQGKGKTAKQYAARYICSLVADFHRTLLYGGWAGNPRSHLRLVYEANPLSFLAEQAGGAGSTGTQRVLEIQPEALHQRLPLFMGSPEDIEELTSYGDVQQTGGKKYSV